MTGAIFGRASTIAKERKKKDVSRNPASKRTRSLQVWTALTLYSVMGICTMQKSRGTISRDRTQSYISLVIDPQANYSTVVTKAAQLLSLDHEKCSLFQGSEKHLSFCVPWQLYWRVQKWHQSQNHPLQSSTIMLQ